MYSIPHRPEALEAFLCTFASEVQEVPKFFDEYMDWRAKHYFIDLCEKGYEGDHIFVYKLVKFDYQLFGKSIIEPLVMKIAGNLHKANYVHALQTKEDWINLSEDQINEVLDGTRVQAVNIDFNNLEKE